MSSLVCSEKEKIEKATEKLIHEDMPIPRCVTTFFNKYCKNSLGRGYEYVDVITLHHGRLLQRIFCLQMHSLESPATITECARRYEGGKLIASNIYYGGMMHGNIVDDWSKKEFKSGWSSKNTYIDDRATSNFANPRFHLNEAQALEKFGKYSGWKAYTGKLSFFEYLCKYRENPGIEYLVKSGYSTFVSSIRYLNQNGHNFSEIFGVDRKWADYLKSGDFTDLRLIRKYKWIENADQLKQLKNIISQAQYSYDSRQYKMLTSKDYKYMLSDATKDVYNVSSTYKDYLQFAKKLGYPLEEARYRYPKNLKVAHDEAASQYHACESELNEKAIAKYSKQAEKYSWSEKNMCIFPVKKSSELIHESEVLHHCVRTYINKVADGDSMIFFVRHKDKPSEPYVTLELIDNKITQVYGEHDTKPKEDASQFVMDWKKKFHFKGWSADGAYRYN